MSEPVSNDGYLRFPAINGDTLVFVCEDDVWGAPAVGGAARRLTADLADIEHPRLSPDGAHLAFTSTTEGDPEVYVQPVAGGTARRLTWYGDPTTTVRGFDRDGRVLFTSAAGAPFAQKAAAYAVPVAGGPAQRLPYGPVGGMAYGPRVGVLLGRNTADPARWKRYRGGTAGRLWIDADGTGTYYRLLAGLDGNIASPMWVGDRVFFLSDHEGIGNLYSCTPAGCDQNSSDLNSSDLRRHTAHDTYYARWASTDGARIVYQHAGDVWLFDPADDTNHQVPLRLGGPRTQRVRRFVDAERHLGHAALHPAGHSVVADVRGKLVSLGCWEEAVRQHGAAQGVRYRHACYLGSGGAQLAAVSDADGEDGLDVFTPAPGQEGRSRRLGAGRIGRVLELAASPDGATIALANQRRELLVVDVADGATRVLDEAPAGPVSGLAWSPDSRWLAYSIPSSTSLASIRLVEVASGAAHPVTSARFRDEAPSFDPEGRYLYFLSWRTFDPVPDGTQLDYGFPKAGRPYLVTLRDDLRSPFTPTPHPLKDEAKDADKDDDTDRAGTEDGSAAAEPLRIDLDGIDGRIVAFPVAAERYRQVIGIGEKVLLGWDPVEVQRFGQEHRPERSLAAYDLVTNEHKVLSDRAGPVTVSADRSTMLYRSGDRLRVLRAGVEDPKDVGDEPGRESGWVDTDRIRVAVDPGAEWPQMLAEAWRLQRDYFFWASDVSGADWRAILDRYRPLAERVATRAEFSDLLWEVQGELGTSHAYEFGGDYRPTSAWSTGQLAADLRRDPDSRHWHVEHIATGDSWDAEATSPLAAPGIGVREGDVLLAVNGQPVDPDTGPGPLLVHQAGQAVALTVAGPDGVGPREVTVTALRDERPARYREWVERNRARVRAATDGQVGYLHIPDMSPAGFAEFHRYYLAEFERDALVVDIRVNGGGHVSGLLLQKLARPRLGYELSRWGLPQPYLPESPAGPMVCVTDEHASSDGDIFAHGFSMLGLGTVVGMRTWGGVMGMTGAAALADGTVTTQPEYAFWYADVGWGLENHGAEPDIERDIAPHEYAAGEDPQLALAIEVVLGDLHRHQPRRPDLDARPPLAAPTLDPR